MHEEEYILFVYESMKKCYNTFVFLALFDQKNNSINEIPPTGNSWMYFCERNKKRGENRRETPYLSDGCNNYDCGEQNVTIRTSAVQGLRERRLVKLL